MGPFRKNWLVLHLTRQHLLRGSRHARGRMLDVGCGVRPSRHPFAGTISSWVGLDRNPDCRPGVVGDAQRLPFRDLAFDTLLCSQVLEHLPEPGLAMTEMARVLRPGGNLILTAPHIWGIHEEPHDYYRFTRYGLAHLMARAGLEAIEIRAMAGFWVTFGARFCYYLEAFERGPLIPLIRLGYGAIQFAAFLLDRLHRVEGDAWNYLAVGRKPGGEDPQEKN
jgi:SAM-dependent methyltransferase